MHTPDTIHTLRIFRSPSRFVIISLCRRPDGKVHDSENSALGQPSGGEQVHEGLEVALLNEEFHRAGVPRVTRGMGEWLVGPSIIAHGTEEQKETFLSRIIDGTDPYCQGFSEPGTGSDLAGLETRGVIDGDEIVISGQKLWTSGAARANKMFVLCRTDPDAEKHAGISFVLIDFTDPAVSPDTM